MTNQIATIGVDPGERWTAGVLRIDDHAIDGFTLGPVDLFGRPFRQAHDDMDPEILTIYTNRIGELLDKLDDKAQRLGYGRPWIGIEEATPPEGAKRFYAAFRSWRITRDVAWFCKGYFAPRTRFVPADGNGERHKEKYGGNGRMQDYYPTELCRRRPSGWLPNEHDKTDRGHERSAFEVAGRIRVPTHRTELIGA